MFSSVFSTSPPVDDKAPNFRSVSESFKENELFGELTPKDTEWACHGGGFITETQVFYTTTEDGNSLMCQVIHSSVGVWFPTIQFTCKWHNPKTGETVWKSLNVSNFTSAPPGLDKRSCKADQFSITHKAAPGTDFPESYIISANLTKDIQIGLEVSRPASVPGWKLGKGEKGGFSYFGAKPASPDGYVIHRFWPRFHATGHFIYKGQAHVVKGPGMFVHAIQGMRPDHVASRWGFANFQSDEHGGVSAIQMEFTTTNAYGKHGSKSGGVSVNVGSLVVGGKLVCVTGSTKWAKAESPVPNVVCRATHSKLALDKATGYEKPGEILFEWAGPSVLPGESGGYSAKLLVDVGDLENPKGLIEKVDVLGEIPYVLKVTVNYVAGTKPFIYQWFNPAKLTITEPGSDKPVQVDGMLYNEATYLS
ncbi:oxidative stress survival Svf1-like protein [Armillaria novae-zelandiae]|uniref:Oxidative stress survival Svf1-like protein n=1 Tax=Armillaria novae-zelandiae TaxID=153914 RepID=A0AA39NUB8_9AGAR|nr:oxidative stress survival Svf1-like protein [Armillaria novae-zelandiae]